MRFNISKRNSTKPERIVYEILKELQIPFRHRWIINGREVDFLVGNYVLEIDGHAQVGERNHWLADIGYIPVHLLNSEILQDRNKIKELIKLLWL